MNIFLNVLDSTQCTEKKKLQPFGELDGSSSRVWSLNQLQFRVVYTNDRGWAETLFTFLLRWLCYSSAVSSLALFDRFEWYYVDADDSREIFIFLFVIIHIFFHNKL